MVKMKKKVDIMISTASDPTVILCEPKYYENYMNFLHTKTDK